jgi:hypothetical protein
MALASALALIALAGCGLEGQPFDSADSKTDSPELDDAVVTPEAISKYPPSSPEAAALRWWRAIQTRDPEAVIASYTPEVRDKLPKYFAPVVVAFVAPSASQSSFAIDYVEPGGASEVAVYVIISGSPDFRMNGPLALPMAKDNDKWLITDATFIEALATAAPPASDTASPSDATESVEAGK